MHGHGHSHGVGHSHAPSAAEGDRERRRRNRRRLQLTLALTASYMLAELVGGWWSGSLALLADAGHMLSDAAALALSLFALWIAQRPGDPQKTYGYYRMEVLAALANGAALLAIAGSILVAAARRLLSEPTHVDGHVVTAVALGGLVVNLTGLAILSRGRDESVNVRGAWLHVLTDTLGSVGAALAGVLVWTLGWMWVDPVLSIGIGLLVVYSAWGLLKEVMSVLMEHAPSHIDMSQVRAALAETPGVLDVHDLHVWVITTGIEALSCHVVAEDGQPQGDLLRALRETLHERFGIHHVTIQIEPQGFVEEQLPV